ncbi:Kae1-associated kinase Bud32 [Acidianus brierleyi]|uniref:non-specific serine/threonine protein kinase n=1 Tax=Acidianus brierleyi TaxID=41673 RepID=A0A2U9IEU4_9CREN|nr:Kae1-associated kinase Bud32 [Acidianus brierleyi]AWR94551.1 Kae1-associated kinase Bud32 [Acidianus brierleyi]
MEKLKILKRGSESIIYEGYFLGVHSIFKKRVSKSYRDSKLDYKINSERTISESRIMYDALKSDVNVPAILFIDIDNFTIIMEYIEGIVVKDLIRNNTENLYDIGYKIGVLTGKLHKASITHGDLTTNNLIINSKNDIFMIDFGLAKRSNDIEDLATDIHVFLRSLESIHPDKKDIIFNGFRNGYSQIVENYMDVLKTVNDIRMRGRYVEERRNKSNN